MLNQELRPERISRDELRNAWLMVVATLVTLVFLEQRMGKIPLAAWAFLGFLFLTGASTLLSNWVDKKTRLRVDGSRVSFTNGMREVSLGWDEIEEINVIPLKWGKSVQVLGGGKYFKFRTLSEIRHQGKIQGRVGFAEGEAVLDYLLNQTALPLSKEEKGSYYYSRA